MWAALGDIDASSATRDDRLSSMKSLAPIETNRATLREVVVEDLEGVHAVLGDLATSGGRSFFQSDRESTASVP